MSAFARRLALWRLLESHPGPLGLKGLAERFEVSKHTIQRDLDALSSAGVPVIEGRCGQTALFSIPRPHGRVTPVEFANLARRAQHDPDRGPRLGSPLPVHEAIEAQFIDERVIQGLESKLDEDV